MFRDFYFGARGLHALLLCVIIVIFLVGLATRR